MTFRVCASLLLIDGYFCQSFGFKEKKILGKIQPILNSLERKKIDEFHIIRPRKKEDLYENIKNDFDILSQAYSLTPTAIGGGISPSLNLDTSKISFERFIFNKSLFDNIQYIEKLRDKFGRQSICAYIPLTKTDNQLFYWDGSRNIFIEYKKNSFADFKNLINEYIFLDAENEGSTKGFNFNLLSKIDISRDKILISGGINSLTKEKAKNDGYSGISIDNRSLFYEEDFVLI